MTDTYKKSQIRYVLYTVPKVGLVPARAQWCPLAEPKEVDLSTFTAHDAAQTTAPRPQFHVPSTGRTIASTIKHGPALQKDGGGLASLGIRNFPELR